MRPRSAALAAAVLVAGCWGASPEEPSAPPPQVVAVRIDGPLDTGTRSLLQRAIRLAQGSRAALLVELDTPGGPVDLMWQLANQIDDAGRGGVTTVAWVNDQALSAGSLLAIACERIYMRSQAVIGAATPVTSGPGGAMVEIPPQMRAKLTSALRSSFRGWAERHGRNPVLAEAMVDPDLGVKRVRVDGEARIVTDQEWRDLKLGGGDVVDLGTISAPGQPLSLSGAEALELGMADGLADTRAQVLDKIGFAGVEPTGVVRSRSEDLAGFLDQIRYLLLVGAIVAAYAEFKAPGFGLPGILSIACFALFLFGRYMVGLADVPHIVAVSLGLVLIAVELFVLPGTIWFGLAGALLVLGGLVLADVLPDPTLPYALDRQYALDRATRLAAGLAVALVACWGLSRLLPHTPLFSRLVLDAGAPGRQRGFPAPAAPQSAPAAVGAPGVALTDLRPVGKVLLDADADSGRDHEARAAGVAIDRGTRVRVVEAHGGRLVVEPLAEERA